MKNAVVDVLSKQSERIALENSKRSITDYRKKSSQNGIVLRFLFECSLKLKIRSITASAAAILFHKFFKETDTASHDAFLIAAASIYLAGKINDDPIRVLDVINVVHSTINRNDEPLNLDVEYWKMRDSIIQAELLIARMLKFELNLDQPQKYLLYFMKSLKDWIDPVIWKSAPIAKAAVAYLQDFHHSSTIINYKPEHVALACLSLTLQTYGIQVPLSDENDDKSVWYRVFAKDLNKNLHWEIIDEIIRVYTYELEIDS